MKISIGCLVQWYECELLHEYIHSLNDAVSYYDGEVIIDILVSLNDTLETPNYSQMGCNNLESFYTKKFLPIYNDLMLSNINNDRVIINWNKTTKLISIADYRRNFNEEYCEKSDVLVWGETDQLFPLQGFELISNLHQNVRVVKYIGFFGCCKMWDDSWKPIEHTDFTDKPFIVNDYDNWWSVKYTMTKDEMNQINDKVEHPNVIILDKHKFNGCGLVISSEVIKAGVNIPKSVFFVHEDTAFQLMIQKVLGNIPQYVFKNILLVHNRNHPNKRCYVLGEAGETLNQKRRSNEWYVKANKMSESNCYNLFNPNYKSFTWNDVFKKNIDF